MKKTELNYEEVYELYINQKKTLKQVAEALGTSTMVVCRFTKANNMTKSKEEVHASIEETNLKVYGVKNPMQNKEIHQKASATYKAKTGYDNPAQNPEVQKKMRATSLEVYGTEVPAQAEEVKAKMAATCKERYGVENYFLIPGVQERLREEYKEKTGYDSPLQNPEARAKRRQTCMERYGAPEFTSSLLPPETREIFSSREKFEAFIQLQPLKTVIAMAGTLGCSDATLVRYLGFYDLWSYIENGSSYGEKELGEFLDSLKIRHERTRRLIKPWEIDLYCPDYKIGIEFNGDYWHQETKVGTRYHRDKSLAAAEKGIFLYHIFEYEWKNPTKQAKIKAQLVNLFGKNSEKIYARQCDLRPVPSPKKTEFLEANHLQGTDTAPIAYGLYYKEELVSIMTFKKPYLNHNFDWELSRFCCKAGISVVGGASRLFKAFLEDYKGTVISYSNNAKTRGGLYETLGFHQEKDSPPSFVYTNGHDITLSRHQSRSEEGKKLIEKYHLYKVYDCGNKVWTYKR